MSTTKVAVSIDRKLLAEVDRLVSQRIYPNRSKAFQAALEDKLMRLRRSRLARESSKLNIRDEQSLADEGMDEALKEWPEY